MNHLNASFLELRQPFGRVVTRGFHHFDTTFDNGIDQPWIVRWCDRRQKREIYAKRLICHGLTTLDFIRELLRRALGQTCDDAQATGIGYGSSHFG